MFIPWPCGFVKKYLDHRETPVEIFGSPAMHLDG